jgi:hypothetical protein
MSEAVLSSQSTEAVIVPPRFRYTEHVNRIIAAGGSWVRFDPAEINGRWPGEKQSILLQAGRLRGLRFETTFRVAGWLCARLVLAPAQPEVTAALQDSDLATAVSQ